MATRELNTSIRNRTVGDAAIDGLMGGIVAGLVMVLLLLVAGVLSGDSPADVIGHFDPAQSNNLISGLLTHLAVSAIYGSIFGLLLLGAARLRPSLVRYDWLAGLIYGLVLFTIARGAIGAGVDSGLARFTTTILLLAHAVYGLVTGFSIGRKWEKANQV